MLTTVVAVDDVGQSDCRVVEDFRTWHNVNRTIYLPSHFPNRALSGAMSISVLDGKRRSGCDWEGRGVFDDRGWWGCHIWISWVSVGLPHMDLRVGLPQTPGSCQCSMLSQKKGLVVPSILLKDMGIIAR